MELLHRLKAKYRHKIEKKYIKAIKRKQLNFNCDEDIIIGIRFLAAVLEVPRYVLAEHLLQLGSYHLIEVIKDLKKREKLVEHLVRVHLMGSELKDDESILTLTENSLYDSCLDFTSHQSE